ncbi:MAG: glycosyltransferase, partial [Firmicutes bacterium]|nr:glycosyltransferase [Bacillota bacterium]
VWPGDQRPYGSGYIDKIGYPADKFEVLWAKGFQPCRQRNAAAKQAFGEILVLFDDDSCPRSDFFKQLEKHYADDDVVGVGGPNPAEPTDKFIPNLVEAVFHSRIAVLSKVSRYKPTGTIRPGTDSDFIFCNFTIRKEIYQQLGGLDARLCPNEENEFFERFFRQFPEKKLIYDPDLIAMEPRPDTIGSFLKKMFGYGRGRGRQFKVKPGFWSGLHLMGGFVIFLPLLLLYSWGWKALLVLGTSYCTGLFCATVSCVFTNSRKSIALALAPAILATHLFYALGLWRGLFSSLKLSGKAKEPIKLERYDIKTKKTIFIGEFE